MISFPALGIDWGERRCGTALANGVMALPFRILDAQDGHALLEELKKLCLAEGIVSVVAGEPLASRGNAAKTAARWAATESAFVEWCRKNKISYVSADERMTSGFVHGVMRAGHDGTNPRGEVTRRRGNGMGSKDVDALAAAKLLQDFIDAANV